MYEILKSRFSKEEAKVFIDDLDAKTDKKIDEKKDVFLTKDDKIDLFEKMNKNKIDLIKRMFCFWMTLVLLLITNWFLKH